MPLGESMITVLRNNNMLRRAKNHLGNKFFTQKRKEKTQYNLPKATPELLEQIRLKIRLEQQQQTIKTLIGFVVVLIILVLIII